MPEKDIRPLMRRIEAGELRSAEDIWEDEIYRGVLEREGIEFDELEDMWEDIVGIEDLNILTVPVEELDRVSTRTFKQFREFKKGELMVIRNTSYEITHAFLVAQDFIAEKEMEDHVGAGHIVPVGLPQVPYSGKVFYNHPEFKTVKDALDHLLNEPIEIEGFSSNIGIREKGNTVEEVVLSWQLNKSDINSQHIRNIGYLPRLNSREYTISDANINENTTYVLKVDDGNEEASASTSITFSNRRYWGVSSEEELNNIPEEFNSELSNEYKQEKEFDCSGGNYIYFIIPNDNGEPKEFRAGGFDSPFYKTEEFKHKNDYGYRTKYSVYRSSMLQNGSSITVEVR